MDKKMDILKIKLGILEKMLSDKSRVVETLIDEQDKHKDILNPNFANRSAGDETNKVKE